LLIYKLLLIIFWKNLLTLQSNFSRIVW
jgi:hypothetical protein